MANNAGECRNSAHGYLLRRGKFVAIDFPGAIATFPGGIHNDGVIVGLCRDRADRSQGFKAVPEDGE